MRFLLTILCAVFCSSLSGAATSHVNWTLSFDPPSAKPGAKVMGKLTAKMDSGWHLYSLSTPPPPVATTIRLKDNPVFGNITVYQPKPIRKHDPNLDADTETYEDMVVFLWEATVKGDAPTGAGEITANTRYQVCSSTSCLPPKTYPVAAQFTVDPSATAAAPSLPSGYSEPKPVSSSLASTGAATEQDIGAFLLIAFGFGLASIFTPCVFPMIPITMSFFLNQENATRKQTLSQAALFCTGIVVLFTALGLVTTAILGPIGVKQLASNPWVNGLICLIFLVFGLSLLGAFEITIPSAVLTRLDRASQGGGVIGTLLMGLTFSLASFACVGPFVGTLLAASAQGGGVRPLLGMVVFAMGLATPFFLLALFPAYLKKLPRSGGWLARVKVVMGFVVLAAMLKYLVTVDQVLQWGFLTRERFLAAWIVLFGMAGLYLLGFLRLEGIAKDEQVGLGRLLTGMAFVIFGLTLIPGMFGGKLGELDAYVPPSESGASFSGGSQTATAAWIKDDLPQALAKAKAESKRVLVSFTGYGCTNCHWMKANMFTRPEIAALLKDFVLVELYTDGTDAASEQNQKLEETRWGTIATPFYVIMDPAEKVVATFPALTRNTNEYAAFLQTQAPPTEATQPQTVAASQTPSSELDALPLTTITGAAFDHSQLRDKVVVVDFWATWCVPCRQEIPDFNRMHKRLAGKEVVVIGVSLDEDGASVVTPFLKEHPINYTVALGAQSINDTMKISQLPTTVVFDRTGKPVERFEGLTSASKIEEALRKL